VRHVYTHCNKLRKYEEQQQRKPTKPTKGRGDGRGGKRHKSNNATAMDESDCSDSGTEIYGLAASSAATRRPQTRAATHARWRSLLSWCSPGRVPVCTHLRAAPPSRALPLPQLLHGHFVRSDAAVLASSALARWDNRTCRDSGASSRTFSASRILSSLARVQGPGNLSDAVHRISTSLDSPLPTAIPATF
jgi:hypothetical protein